MRLLRKLLTTRVNMMFEHKNYVVILTGETGSGKSSQIPQYVVDKLLVNNPECKLQIAYTQPDRIAATSVTQQNPVLDRVFISANPRNIEVFKAISNHDVYRAQITEIVWDDALLASTGPEHDPSAAVIGAFNDCDDERKPCPEWYDDACEGNNIDLGYFLVYLYHKSGDPVEQQIAAQISLEESWTYYQGLLRQQQEVLDSRAHVRALESGIGRFPTLRKITVAATIHGRIFVPIYETPMIRAFPRGFNYPIPNWPRTTFGQVECPDWDENDKRWEGLRVVVHLLAQNFDSGKVTELHVDSFQLRTGLNSRLFEKPCPTLANLEVVLGRANFESLHLDLMVNGDDSQADVFGRGLLKRAIDGAAGGQGLKRLALGTNNENTEAYFDTWCVPFKIIYEPSSLQHLEHFSLSRFPVIESDLLALLATLPYSIRTIELRFLDILEGNHRSLLYQIRDTLGWQSRNPKPRLSLCFEPSLDCPELALWLENEVYTFLYEGGAHPFSDNPDVIEALGLEDIGVIKDVLNPGFQRSNLDRRGLVEIGYLEAGDRV
ncbi:hypothetical protein E0Z10_g10389 [Xylaria hypoxylon]|uniref:Helicase ATP-binding domain-containing protein n=1 Tax=Xylaria hypoxylon TaxID=37992 RepID=A0A4Z0YGK6_9PEZI|nr:hypothetical protein E0Z10_g10389 [Xylaria hypoxylon]